LTHLLGILYRLMYIRDFIWLWLNLLLLNHFYKIICMLLNFVYAN
jgi:hypothetical protein